MKKDTDKEHINKHVVLVGLNFFPKRHPGDKVFWFELIPLLARKMNRITILSVRGTPEQTEEYHVNGCLVQIKYISPKLLKIGDKKTSLIFWNSKKSGFPKVLGVIEKLLNARHIVDELRVLRKEAPYDVVHLMDNFGFANRIIARSVPRTVSVSAMAYQGKTKIIYDTYLRLSYMVPGLKVVPYSHAYADKLARLGVHENCVRCIKWGVATCGQRLNKENKEAMRSELSIPTGTPLFVWAGYIQQIQEKDFLYALKAARKALSNGINCTFFFAFKDTVKQEFIEFGNAEKKIVIKKTSAQEFDLLKKAADVLYSPVVNKNSIVAPPLTWIEFLNYGVPILTKDAKGVDEIIKNGETGYAAVSDSDLQEKMFDILRNYGRMSDFCYDKVSGSYDIERSARDYLDLWYSGKD